MRTVNVIDCSNRDNFQIDGLCVFPDNEEGNKKAEKLFRELVLIAKGEVNPSEMDRYLEDGICEIGDGCIALVHSTGSDEHVETTNRSITGLGGY